ncbi:Neur_chan_LBD domain-containing protein [Caenorhabditis elegans]|uniref:Neur_chan_LBD domain-containing protein n=1 Tax=Caenorhabditis elegans TaxID=6239 RepID=Q23048_CAEEL|nr:Neur_chan_LBD domain-containing protein [Caenorhabditis elegans]CCD74238.1 Neur_chan_LBD domain-containing protein [Caenorhabditis elegans]|eukprot:NP_504710.1 Uncharacterized protein CELE_T25F10.4 [Caenorhabditis elegans]
MWWSLFFLATTAILIKSENSTGRTDILVIAEHPKFLSLNEEKSSLEISFEICFEWETKRGKEPRNRELTTWSELDAFGIITESLENHHVSKSIVTRENQIQNVRSSRSVIIQSEKSLDFSSFPSDAHLFQLRFTSIIRNSSQLTLNPHFVSTAQEQSNSYWNFEVSKAFVQWIVHKNESFEQAIFEFRVTRRPPTFQRIGMFLLFLLNVSMIFEYFPVSRIFWNLPSSRFYLCCGFLISLVSASQGPKSGKLTSFDYQLMTLLLLEVFIEILHQLLPFFIFHLRCCPIESDPTPPLFPSPSDQFSLDTERSKCNAALDSARAESMRSPRIANFDMCLAEVKFTMSTFNEVLNLHSSAEWRRKLWLNAYRRFEILAFIVLQIINFVLFSTFYQ